MVACQDLQEIHEGASLACVPHVAVEDAEMVHGLHNGAIQSLPILSAHFGW